MAERPFKRCIFFLIDGARADVMRDFIEAGELPSLQRYVLDRGDYRTAVTSFPSTTGPGHVPFLTGCMPGSSNLPGIRWFDRSQPHGFTHFNQSRSYVGPGGFYMDRDLREDIRTIFEYFERPAGVFSFLNRGLGVFENKTLLAKNWYWLYGHYSGRWQAVDDAAWRYIDRAVDRADFLSVVFPAVDEYSHYTDPFSDETLEAYRAFDRGLGRLAERLGREGSLDDTLFVVSSDHGLTTTHTHFELWSFLDELGFNTLYYPRILRNGCNAASMVSGNGMAHIYLKSGDTWAERPSHDEIRSMGETDVIEALLSQEAVDLVAVGAQDDGVIVCSRRGTAEIREIRNGLTYRVREGEDPFGYGDLPVEMSQAQALSATFDTDYPDAPYQLLKVVESPRSGDVIVSARKGYDLRIRHEYPEHKASHGSLHRDHMHVPLLMNTQIPADYVRTVDLFPAMLRLTGHSVEGDIDGTDFIAAA